MQIKSLASQNIRDFLSDVLPYLHIHVRPNWVLKNYIQRVHRSRKKHEKAPDVSLEYLSGTAQHIAHY